MPQVTDVGHQIRNVLEWFSKAVAASGEPSEDSLGLVIEHNIPLFELTCTLSKQWKTTAYPDYAMSGRYLIKQIYYLM